MPSSARLLKGSRATGTNERLNLNLFWPASEDPLDDNTKYDQGPQIHGEPRRVSLNPESVDKWSVGVGRRHPVTIFPFFLEKNALISKKMSLPSFEYIIPKVKVLK